MPGYAAARGRQRSGQKSWMSASIQQFYAQQAPRAPVDSPAKRFGDFKVACRRPPEVPATRNNIRFIILLYCPSVEKLQPWLQPPESPHAKNMSRYVFRLLEPRPRSLGEKR